MKKFSFLLVAVCASLPLAGCGSKKGGVIDLSNNPYQLTPEETKAANAAQDAVDSRDLADQIGGDQ